MRADGEQRFANIVSADSSRHRSVRQRIIRQIVQDGARGRADPIGRDLVSWKRQTRSRVSDLRTDARKIAVAPSLRRDRCGGKSRSVVTRPLVVGKKEQRVGDEAATERAAENV